MKNHAKKSEIFKNILSIYFLSFHEAIIRGISLAKCPEVGFGFGLENHKVSNDQSMYFVSEIAVDSPAEFCLQPGDILLEIDEVIMFYLLV